MAKHTLKILRCEHRKNFKVCLAIFPHYAIKGYVGKNNPNTVKFNFPRAENQMLMLLSSKVKGTLMQV